MAQAGLGTAPGTSGSTSLCTGPICNVIADGTTVIGDYGIASSTAGRIHDTGSATPPANKDSFLILSVATVGNLAKVEINTPDFYAAQALGKIYALQISAVGLTAGDTVNFNATTPADGGAYGNCAFATSKSGTTDSVSLNCDAPITTAVSGINPAVAVQAATTAAGDTSTFTYLNGVAGVGATLTGPTNNVAVIIDGFTFTALGQRLLVKNDTQQYGRDSSHQWDRKRGHAVGGKFFGHDSRNGSDYVYPVLGEPGESGKGRLSWNWHRSFCGLDANGHKQSNCCG